MSDVTQPVTKPTPKPAAPTITGPITGLTGPLNTGGIPLALIGRRDELAADLGKRLASGLAGVVAALLALTTLSLVTVGSVGKPGDNAPTERERSFEQRVPGAAPLPAADGVLPGLDPSAPGPSPAVLTGLLQPLLAASALAHSASLDVMDPQTGQHLALVDQSSPRVPASTTKLLTAAAVLSLIGPHDTLPTRVVSNGPGTIVLVGGGDVLLGAGRGDPAAVDGRAGLADLAARTAAGLQAQGRRQVSLRLDDRLYTGPTVNPAWSPTDVSDGFVAPIQPLEVDAGRLTATEYGARSGDPALRAAKLFAGLLAKDGITVTGSVGRAAAQQSAPVLGEVRSAPLGDVVEYALTQSDNTVAESLARLVAARTGQPTTFAGAGTAVLRQVGSLGVPVGNAHLVDGSGLGDGSVVAPATLTGVLSIAAGDDRPELRPLLTGLPVAGVSGTLSDRFGSGTSRDADGVVRAKTGTLTGVSSLAGTVVDADGRLLVFAAMADGVQSTDAARKALDTLVGMLARCGCR